MTTEPKILVLGDIILDKYLLLWGNKENPETDGTIYRIIGEDNRLGGAAAVALMCKSLGVNVKLAGVLGENNAGTRCLEGLLDHWRINNHILKRRNRTTVKTRMRMGDVLYPDRFDNEDSTPIDPVLADQLLEEVAKYDIILISDYGKGVCSDYLLERLPGRTSGKLILVDPAYGRTWDIYRKAAVIKANEKEAIAALSSMKTVSHISDYAKTLSDLYDRSVVVTRGSIGIQYAYHNQTATTRDHTNGFIPAVKVDEVVDTCGAGDTIFAVIGVFLSRGYGLKDACEIATQYAAQQIKSVGICPLTPIEIEKDYAKIH